MNNIRDGDLYGTFEIEGVRFVIYYGYSTESERALGWEPSPIYPDFVQAPQYTQSGQPFATAYQDACEHYMPIIEEADDNWCHNCKMFDKTEKHIGICRCEQRRKHISLKTENSDNKEGIL